ncbi:hypothetical protein RvY_08534 [Ramazzottius varieornatus]|uniref:Alpha-1,3-glucosyltransferase n=1 Tax=Ramazzottius varieornatus TaxID=947166 RepID=A0A1D1VAS7_RAMVA|nr:hypothetical protein RvY_08534 [Ramazzottius varieornatus]
MEETRGKAPWLRRPPMKGEGIASSSRRDSSGGTLMSAEERLRMMRVIQAREMGGSYHEDPYAPHAGAPDQATRKDNNKSSAFTVLLIAVTTVKLLLFTSYRSTDFEVHRNWLAITHSLPMRQWYVDATSEWTLDYPPLFAWLEFCLSHIARFFDARMLKVQNLNYSSPQTILFQRLTVVLADSVYIYAVSEGCRLLTSRLTSRSRNILYSPATVYSLLMLWNVGLLIVDHIHFQYNGFLLGLLQLAVFRVVERRFLAAAFYVSVALNMKHIFLYMAPAFGVYLLRQCCFPNSPHLDIREFNVKNFAALGSIFALVTAIAFGPFAVFGQLPQVFRRLFPFQRGLTHAYWAPNVWALYNGADTALTVLNKRFHFLVQSVQHVADSASSPDNSTLDAVPLVGTEQLKIQSLTGGVVGAGEPNILPAVSPSVTMCLTILGMFPALWSLWRAKVGTPNLASGDVFVRGLVGVTLSSFLFGWHVHEKAILLAIVPLTWLAISSANDARLFLLLSTAGLTGLHPLLFTPSEIPLKYMMIFLYIYAAFKVLKDRFSVVRLPGRRYCLPLLNRIETLYVLGFLPVEFYNAVVHESILGLCTKLPFLPLMVTSMYCAIGVVYVYVLIVIDLFRLSR